MLLHQKVATQRVGNTYLASDGYLTHGPLSAREQKLTMSRFLARESSVSVTRSASLPAGRRPSLATLLTRASTLQPMKAMLCVWLPVFWHLPKCSGLGSILKGLSRWIWRFSLMRRGSAGVAASHPLISPL